MTMTPEVEIARKRKKRKDALGAVWLMALIVAATAVSSWIQFEAFDMFEPSTRITVILSGWIGIFALLAYLIKQRFNSQ